jgi:hypothetical protein
LRIALHITMTVSASPTSSSLQALLRWTRWHTIGSLFALSTLLIAWIVQVSALSAWNWELSATRIALTPMNASVSADANNNTLAYAFAGAPAVSATKTINVATDSVLAVDVTLDRVPPQTTLTLGWVGTRDRRKPSNLAVRLPASDSAQTYRILLRGHSQWRDNITQVALVLISRPGNPPITLTDARWVSATPASATAVSRGAWFDDATQLRAPTVTQRVLPLAALLGFAAIIAALAIAWFKRNDARLRRDALVGAAVVFTAVSATLTLLAPAALAINLSVLPWSLAATAVCFSLWQPWRTRMRVLKFIALADVVAIAMAAAATLTGGFAFSWTALVVAWAIAARQFPRFASNSQAAMFLLPAIAIGSVVQAANAKHVELPAQLMTDPSSSFALALHAAAALPALFIALLVLHWAWPRTTAHPRNARAGIALWLTLLGSIVSYAWVLAQSQQMSAGVAWVLLPSLIASFAWLAPKFLSPLDIASTTAVKSEKTESDLSSVVRQLFEGAASSFDAALASDHPGTALSPLKRLREIAPASAITHAAELRYALAHGETEHTRDAYARLKQIPASAASAAANDALVSYAHRHDDFDVLRERAPDLTDEGRRAFYVAYAELFRSNNESEDSGVGGPDSALAALAALQSPPASASQAFNRSIVELHLLKDDWRAAQVALEKTDIKPQSTLGEIYVARLGFRATQSAAYVEKIQKLATWHNTIGAAQAAMGELLLTQGNAAGAKARFQLAIRLDETLWPLEWRIRRIDGSTSSP